MVAGGEKFVRLPANLARLFQWHITGVESLKDMHRIIPSRRALPPLGLYIDDLDVYAFIYLKLSCIGSKERSAVFPCANFVS
jgi:hypothetical protein